jgi:hypothetical protein
MKEDESFQDAANAMIDILDGATLGRTSAAVSVVEGYAGRLSHCDLWIFPDWWNRFGWQHPVWKHCSQCHQISLSCRDGPETMIQVDEESCICEPISSLGEGCTPGCAPPIAQ